MSTVWAREWAWNIFRGPKARRGARKPPKIGLHVAAIWVVGCLLIAALAQVISPYHPAQISLDVRLSPPLFFGGTLDHLLGTDELGRDVLARLIYSIQISMLVAVGGTFISTLLGVSLGFLAAELGGLIDEGVMALVDMQAAVPFMMTALLVITIFGNSLALFVCLVGLHGWERHARIARGLALTARNRLHVTAARTYNASRRTSSLRKAAAKSSKGYSSAATGWTRINTGRERSSPGLCRDPKRREPPPALHMTISTALNP
ncbi:hypothetical protein CV770_11245 [Bradyrhizobium sp. AC87j1]|uniref:ABC transporter permease n=1 Tax=Bradyrhizobium sp. AC87j1 TaxID=2055894 RepID=UPI000CEC5200|nr:ABC transporter permease [Bradyrhizobium sp. AC87j1]PPQ19241.1 hypothetical protein CV770_11245 [Bradyrhizobium sp. AC87j1]